jgi:WD40 repeat protein
MPDHDRTFIDPTRAALNEALAAAAAAANAGARTRLLAWPPADLAGDFRKLDAAPGGFRQWSAGEGRGRSGEARSVVALAWWTDLIARKHHRVVGRRRPFNNAARQNVLAPGEERPPLWLVYPDNVYLYQRQRQWRPFAVCACGAAGEPEALGWMGACCGPCHDRREAADAPPTQFLASDTVGAGHRGNPGGLRFSADGEQLLTRGLYDGTVRIWNLTTGKHDQWASDNFLWDAVLTPNGPLALLTVRLPFTPLVLRDFAGGTDTDMAPQFMPLAVTFSPDGGRLAYLRMSPREVVLCDLPSPTPRATFPAADIDSRLLVFSPDGQSLAAAGSGGTVRHWDLAAGRERPALRVQVPADYNPADDGWEMAFVGALAFSADGRTLATGQADGSVGLWDVATGAHRTTLPFAPPGRVRVAFSPDGQALAATGGRGELRLWDWPALRQRGTFRWHTGPVAALAFRPSGRWLATLGGDDRVKLWPWEQMRA